MTRFLASLAVVAAELDVPTMEIAPGVNMPMAGLGTWQWNNKVAESAVSMALASGVRLIDTANSYKNQVGIGAAIKASGVARDELFITTKVPGGLSKEKTVKAHESNLQDLGVDYVDLLLTHFPCGGIFAKCNKEERQATWRGLEEMQKAGKARAIGVSHYCQQHMEDVLEIATVPISVNQQEWHVGQGPDPEGVRSYCDAHNISFQSFSPLCTPDNSHTQELISGDLVTGIGNAHGKSGPQVALKWLVENGSPVIAKTSNPTHLAENMDLFSWDLTTAELTQLSAATSPASVETVAKDCKIKEVAV